MATIESLADEVAALKAEVAKKADNDYVNESFNSILQYVDSTSAVNNEMFNNLSNMISDLYALISALETRLAEWEKLVHELQTRKLFYDVGIAKHIAELTKDLME